MKSFKADQQEPMKRAGVVEYQLKKEPTEIVIGCRPVKFPRNTSRKPRVTH